jgi:flagellar biosynthesis protein FliP
VAHQSVVLFIDFSLIKLAAGKQPSPLSRKLLLLLLLMMIRASPSLMLMKTSFEALCYITPPSLLYCGCEQFAFRHSHS